MLLCENMSSDEDKFPWEEEIPEEMLDMLGYSEPDETILEYLSDFTKSAEARVKDCEYVLDSNSDIVLDGMIRILVEVTACSLSEAALAISKMAPLFSAVAEIECAEVEVSNIKKNQIGMGLESHSQKAANYINSSSAVIHEFGMISSLDNFEQRYGLTVEDYLRLSAKIVGVEL